MVGRVVKNTYLNSQEANFQINKALMPQAVRVRSQFQSFKEKKKLGNDHKEA